MYLKFFGLSEKPFELTPDPKFLFLTPGHREALAQLTYGVQEQKGFILMTGEVGTGKTTLLRTLVQRMEGQIESALIINSTLPFDEILEYVLADLGIPDPKETRAQRLMALNAFLIEQRRAKRKTILIIDEAQNLSIETLEQIRLLSNFETNSEKLIQIILSGQPELQAKLQLTALRQLKQRIGLRCTLAPMTPEQVEQYIVSHIRVAGGRRQMFTPAAVRQITQYSRGIPRVVNMICDHCLLLAYADQARDVDGGIAKRAIAYIEAGGADPNGWRQVRRLLNAPMTRQSRRDLVAWSAGAVAVAAATFGIASQSAYRSALHAIFSTMESPFGGVVRWLTHWWGS
ncbi:MAG TPA: AAA family ATPase [Methylomirabilota bacterium]|jgi:general secretion pathway protein A|nr:AAA family ATPase [Methylomirabilota bacterium]